MRAVVQRVDRASVTIDGNVNGKIEKGFMVLIGIDEKAMRERAKGQAL